MSDFWSTQLGPVEDQAPYSPRNLAEEYRAHQASKVGGGSGSLMYSLPTAPEQRAAAAAQMKQIYEAPREYGGLGSYAGKSADKLARRPGESPEAYRRRVLQVARALPDEEVAARLQAIDEGVNTHDELRAQLDARQRVTGVDRGIIDMSPAQRAALVQQRPGAMTDLDSRSTPMSPAAMRQAMHEREQAQRNAPPQRTPPPAGSSGTGWSVTR